MWKKKMAILTLMVILFSGLVTAAAYAYTVSQTWGTVNEGAGLILNTPVALAMDSAGNVYVADMGNHRIVKMNQSGSVISKTGTLGSGNGQFNTPFGVQIDNLGNILVADTANYRVQKFDSSWNYLTQWGTQGSGNGQFGLPREIAVDSQNRYHVVDEYNDRIEVFDSNGSYLYQYGGFGTGNGQFRLPQGIAIKQSVSGDRVYIADTYNNRIQCLDVNGNFISQIGTGVQGDANYQFYHPRGVNIDSSGNVFVADTYNHKIKKYDSSHTFKYSVGMGTTATEPLYPNQVKPLNNGYFMVSDTGNSQILKYLESSRGTSASLSAHIGTLRTADGVFSEVNSASTDASGNIYVADSFNHRIQKFDVNGNFVAKWGKNSGAGGPANFGVFNGQFNVPRQVWVDKPNNKVYIADTGNSRIQVFDTNGTYLTKFGLKGSANGQFNLPMGVAVDANGNVFVSDTLNSRIQKFNSSYQYVTQWGSYGLSDGQFREPCHIAVDSSGNVYVADRINNRVQKFDNNGNFLAKWGSNGGIPNVDPLLTWGIGDGDLFLPMGINVDSSGYVYVADTSNNRMQKFTSNGAFVEKWGIFSGTAGNFFSPQGIGINTGNGNLYIPDALLNRVQVFTP